MENWRIEGKQRKKLEELNKEDDCEEREKKTWKHVDLWMLPYQKGAQMPS